MTENWDELTYKEAFDMLQLVVEQLEGGQLELEQALELYKKGIVLSQICSSRLEQAELKIRTMEQAG